MEQEQQNSDSSAEEEPKVEAPKVDIEEEEVKADAKDNTGDCKYFGDSSCPRRLSSLAFNLRDFD